MLIDQLKQFLKTGVTGKSYPTTTPDILQHYFNYEASTHTSSVNIALILRDGATHPKSSAFIRLISPLTHDSMKQSVRFSIFPENTILDDAAFDVCIVQRNAYDDVSKAKALVSSLSKNTIKLVVDNDDGFIFIDQTHPEFTVHKDKIAAMNLLIQAADQLWVSTPRLASAYAALSKHDPVVILNSLDERIWKQAPNKHQDPIVNMLYMGTATHDEDFNLLFPALEKAAAAYPDSFRLSVIGVSRSIPDRTWITRIVQPANCSIYPKFVSWLQEINHFDIGLSPLVNNAFNTSKSDIKCLDYIATGVLPVVSNLEPYASPALDDFIVRVDDAAWYDTLSSLLSDVPGLRTRMQQSSEAAQNYVWSMRDVQTTSKLQLELLTALVTK